MWYRLAVFMLAASSVGQCARTEMHLTPLPMEGPLGYLAPINCILRLLANLHIYAELIENSPEVHQETTSGITLTLLDALRKGSKVDAGLMVSLQNELFELYKHETVILNDPVKVFRAIRGLLDKFTDERKFWNFCEEIWEFSHDFPEPNSVLPSLGVQVVMEGTQENLQRLYKFYDPPANLDSVSTIVNNEYGCFVLEGFIMSTKKEGDSFACVTFVNGKKSYMETSTMKTGPFDKKYWNSKETKQQHQVLISVYGKFCRLGQSRINNEANVEY